jgi:iron complex outermembrane receptor protein
MVIFASLLLPVFGFAEIVFAQQAEDTGPEDMFEMDIEQLMEIEVEMVTTASKTTQKITEAPSSVTVITADEIRLYGHRTLADILRSVKGFYTSYDRSYEHVGVRGFSLPGDTNTRVLILVDGFRMNENVKGHGGIGHEFLLNTDLIDRVEIVRGPGSALYGSNAVFGVINVITKKGKDYDGFEFSGDMFTEKFSRFEAQRGRITYGKEFNNGLDWVISGSLSNRDGRMMYYPHFNERAVEMAADPCFVMEPGQIWPPDGYTPNDDESFHKFFTKLTLDEFTLEAGFSRRKKQIPTAPLGAVFEPEYQHYKFDTQAFIGLTYQHEFSDTSSILGRLSYNAYNHRRKVHYFSEQWWEYDQFGYVTNPEIFDRRGTWWNGEVQYTHQPIENHQLTWGVEFQYNGRQDMDLDRRWDEAIEAPDPCDPCEVIITGFDSTVEQFLNVRKNSRWLGFYVQDEWTMSDTWALNAGVRYDDIQGALARDTINPRFALINQWSETTTAKWLYGTSFRAPTVQEVYYQNEESDTAQVSAESLGGLETETIETYEFVLEHYFKPNIRGSLSIFHYKLHDFINLYSHEAGPPYMLRWGNWGMAEATGMELGLEGKSQSGIWARASYSITDATYGAPTWNTYPVWDPCEGEWYDETDGVITHHDARMANSPLHLAKLNVIFPVVEDKLFAGFEAQYSSRRRTLAEEKSNSYLLSNLTFTWVDAMKNMDISFGIYNLFNTRYYHPAWGDNELDSIEQNGRSFLFNMRYRF